MNRKVAIVGVGWSGYRSMSLHVKEIGIHIQPKTSRFRGNRATVLPNDFLQSYLKYLHPQRNK